MQSIIYRNLKLIIGRIAVVFIFIFFHFVGYHVLEWMLLEEVDDFEQLSEFLWSDFWAKFSQTQAYVQFKAQYLARDVDLSK